MANTKPLTKHQMETLRALREGKVMTLDSRNMPSIAGQSLAPVTRYFLTSKRLVERVDPTRSVSAAGNGYKISDLGLSVLSEHESKTSTR